MMLVLSVIVALVHVARCSYNCSQENPNCYCDVKCALYGDCCHPVASFGKERPFKDVLKCKRFTRFISYWVFDKCLSSEHRFANLCSKTEILPENRLRSLIPVITSAGEVFENVFCAKCHNKTEFRYLNTTVNCLGTQPTDFHDLKRLINGRHRCQITPKPSPRMRQCNGKIVHTCPKNYRPNSGVKRRNYELCEKKTLKHQKLFTDRKMVFKNKYCCACWTGSCFPHPYATSHNNEGYSGEFSYLLNFNEWDEDKMTTNQSTVNSTQNVTGVIEDDVIYYVSFVLTILSLLALIVLIIIYVSHTIFHNFGGYLTLCLCCCQSLLYIVTLMLTNETISNSSLCKFIGILQHFIALCNFNWMALYALDLVQTFGLSSTSRSEKKSFKSFLVYCFIGFGVALVIVAGATVTEFCVSVHSRFRPHYGGDHCWFTSKLGGIVWYFAPVCVLLAWNSVACVVVLYSLSKTTAQCKVVRNDKTRGVLCLCIRLTSVFGIGYLFQVIAVFTVVKELIVVGSMINCLQGAFLVTCFIWTRRVRVAVSSTLSGISRTSRLNTLSKK